MRRLTITITAGESTCYESKGKPCSHLRSDMAGLYWCGLFGPVYPSPGPEDWIQRHEECINADPSAKALEKSVKASDVTDPSAKLLDEMTDNEWLRSSAEASPRLAARVYEKFRQGLSVDELARRHGVGAATIEALVRAAMIHSAEKKSE